MWLIVLLFLEIVKDQVDVHFSQRTSVFLLFICNSEYSKTSLTYVCAYMNKIKIFEVADLSLILRYICFESKISLKIP